ncbi:ABC transporter permease [Lactobacillus sp. CBA3605]|uniref:ABC transporter permease n=1 Tax=Lactobacillus sp. CBA3605 TaxID=2099788 RepID=UPI000CFAA375|nr:ABC transporter permease [Lactobacillus sp. CBA3605]AVK61077.1 ABC transporter permease [Lactobacillus sp. CBA3605]
MNKTWIVTSETFLRQTKSWSFLMLILMPFLFMGLTLGITYVSAPNRGSNEIAVISSNSTLRKSLLKTNQVTTTSNYATIKAAKTATYKNDISGYLVLKQTAQHQLVATFHGPSALASTNQAQLQRWLSRQQAHLNQQQAHLTIQQVRALALQPQLKQRLQKKTAADKTAKTISFYLLVFFVYLILTTYSSITAQEIAAEKGTKIMEVIFSSTTPRRYFNGKVYGVLLMILTQLLVYLLGGVVILQLVPHSPLLATWWAQYAPIITKVLHNLLSINLIFALAAVLLYTVVSAFCGALVTRVEDAGKASQPVIYLNLLTFFTAMAFQNNPTNPFVTIFSYVPFFSSYLMPLRLINATATLPAASLSLILLLLTVVGSMWYIGKVYGGLMLQTDELGFWGNLKRGLHLK